MDFITTYFLTTFSLKMVLYVLLFFVWSNRISKGLRITRAYNLFAWLIFITTFFMTVELYFHGEILYLPFDNFVWQVLGMILISFGTLMLVWSLFIFKFLGPRESTLITYGPYSHTRNPQYLGLISIFFGLSLFLDSFNFFVFSIALTIFSFLMVFYEEKELKKAFGYKFLDYKEKVPRFFPR